jgi:hypothetical protein
VRFTRRTLLGVFSESLLKWLIAALVSLSIYAGSIRTNIKVVEWNNI